jgi:uncharacterized protein
MPTYPTDHAGLETLPLPECLRLLSQVPVGRVGFAVDGEITVLPVNHAVDGESVVFRSAAGSKLTAAAGQDAVVFEADDYDALSQTGWSVVVNGRAEPVYDEAEIQVLESAHLATWPDGVDRPYWIRIRPSSVTGRRLPDRSGESGPSRRGRGQFADGASHEAVVPQVFNVLAAEARRVRKTPFGSVGTVLAGRRMEFVWVSKHGEPIDDSWFSMKEVELLMVVQGQLRLEFDSPGQRDLVLGVGEVLVLPADARCRASKWPHDADQATIFVAAYPTPGREPSAGAAG